MIRRDSPRRERGKSTVLVHLRTRLSGLLSKQLTRYTRLNTFIRCGICPRAIVWRRSGEDGGGDSKR